MLVMVDLDSNSEKPRSIENTELIKPTGNLPTPAEGTGMARVRKTEPIPLPQRTLPATRTGSKTLYNPYVWFYRSQLIFGQNVSNKSAASFGIVDGLGIWGGFRWCHYHYSRLQKGWRSPIWATLKTNKTK